MRRTTPAGTPETLQHPERKDGQPWPFLMIHGDQATFADTRTELVGALIDGYDDFPDDPRGYERSFEARYTQAVAVATDVQTSILLDAAEKGDFDPDRLLADPVGEAQLQAFMIERTVAFDPAGTALERFSDDDGPVWTHQVPLVLIATDYAPFTDLVPPSGSVVVIDPSEETSYLDSLQALNRVMLFVHEDA